VLTALTLGHRFGIVAMLPNSIPRHLRYLWCDGPQWIVSPETWRLNLTIAEMAQGGNTGLAAARCRTPAAPRWC
jgi:allantoin racemase